MSKIVRVESMQCVQLSHRVRSLWGAWSCQDISEADADADLVVADSHFPWSVIPARRVADHCGCPLITWIHSGPGAKWGTSRLLISPFVWSAYWYGLRYAVRNSDLILTIGSHIHPIVRGIDPSVSLLQIDSPDVPWIDDVYDDVIEDAWPPFRRNLTRRPDPE